VLPEKRVGSLFSQGGRLRVVMTAVVTREGVMAIRIAEDGRARNFRKRGFDLGLSVLADEFVFFGKVHQQRR
jgi:hypothetical protein